MMTSVRVTLVIIGTAAYLGLAILGWGGWTAGFAGDGAPWLRNSRRGNTMFVFALPEDPKK